MSRPRYRDAMDPWDAEADAYDDDEIRSSVNLSSYFDLAMDELYDPTDGQPAPSRPVVDDEEAAD